MRRFVTQPAFAKVNLCLQVHCKRLDGYHELRTIFQAISLHDTLELSFASPPGIALEINDSTLPTDSRNLVWRAADAMRKEFRLSRGIRARLTKRIPVARGMGGGSSDAAAALIAMQRLTGRKLPLEKLSQIGSSLGADVPFFLFGGRAMGVSRGDEIYPLPDGPSRSVLVVSAHDIAVSTKDAYAWIDRRLTNSSSPHKIWSFCALCWSRQEGGLPNDFEAAVFSRHPRLRQIKRDLLRGGAAEAALAGSGSAVFGVFRNPAQARRAARLFPKDQVFVTTTLSREEYRKAVGWSGTR
ncbi:MAG TPA: 4-(cytidine 5'-diphospho)-2-C-methyl-D-erythritol kinase [Candidatus Acidoferrales bacterium]|nr:4-(cytidine 5'-diphospho)-2-C-methyl-D-erythritol kinase [Candidatus Acidoferrales bacterium]